MTTTKLALLSTVAMAAFANDGSKPRIEPQLTGVLDASVLAMPERKTKRGSASIYPFASLTAIGSFFGVKNKDAASLSSVVSNANRKAMVKKTDAFGAVIYKTQELTAADGTKTVVPTAEAEMVPSAKYFAIDVDADMAKKLKGTAAEGSKAIVFREI